MTLMHMLSARVATAGAERRSAPPEFSAASEPAERLLKRMKELLERSTSLVENDRVPEEDRASLRADLKRFAFLVEVPRVHRSAGSERTCCTARAHLIG